MQPWQDNTLVAEVPAGTMLHCSDQTATELQQQAVIASSCFANASRATASNSCREGSENVGYIMPLYDRIKTIQKTSADLLKLDAEQSIWQLYLGWLAPATAQALRQGTVELFKSPSSSHKQPAPT